MESIGASIANGAFGAAAHMLGLIPIMLLLVPIMFWVVMVLCILAAIFVIRYITEWKVALVLVAAFFLTSEVMVWRAHWINLGYARAQVQIKAANERMEGFKRTEGLIMRCYAERGQVWDRTRGKCLRTAGDGNAR